MLHLDMPPVDEGVVQAFNMDEFTVVDVKDRDENSPTTGVVRRSTSRQHHRSISGASLEHGFSCPKEEPQPQSSAGSSTCVPSIAAPRDAMRDVGGQSGMALFVKQSTDAPEVDEHALLCRLTTSLADRGAILEHPTVVAAPEAQAEAQDAAEDYHIQVQRIVSNFAQARGKEHLTHPAGDLNRTMGESDDPHGDACKAAFIDLLSKYRKQ